MLSPPYGSDAEKEAKKSNVDTRSTISRGESAEDRSSPMYHHHQFTAQPSRDIREHYRRQQSVASAAVAATAALVDLNNSSAVRGGEFSADRSGVASAAAAAAVVAASAVSRDGRTFDQERAIRERYLSSSEWERSAPRSSEGQPSALLSPDSPNDFRVRQQYSAAYLAAAARHAAAAGHPAAAAAHGGYLPAAALSSQLAAAAAANIPYPAPSMNSMYGPYRRSGGYHPRDMGSGGASGSYPYQSSSYHHHHHRYPRGSPTENSYRYHSMQQRTSSDLFVHPSSPPRPRPHSSSPPPGLIKSEEEFGRKGDGALKYRIMTRPPDLDLSVGTSRLGRTSSASPCERVSSSAVGVSDAPPRSYASPPMGDFLRPDDPRDWLKDNNKQHGGGNRQSINNNAAAAKESRSSASPPPAPQCLPIHFLAGSLIQLSTGDLKRVEELSTEDFTRSADFSPDVRIDHSTVIGLDPNPETGIVTLSFSVGINRIQVGTVSIDIQFINSDCDIYDMLAIARY